MDGVKTRPRGAERVGVMAWSYTSSNTDVSVLIQITCMHTFVSS